MNVLLISNCRTCSDELQENLQRMGMRLLLASDEISARQQLAGEAIDAVLVNVERTQSSDERYDHCQRLREQLKVQVPFIIVQLELGGAEQVTLAGPGEPGYSSLPPEILGLLASLPSDN